MVSEIEARYNKKFDDIPPALKTSVTGAQASAEALLATGADDGALLQAWMDFLFASKAAFSTAIEEATVCLTSTIKSQLDAIEPKG